MTFRYPFAATQQIIIDALAIRLFTDYDMRD